jgi:hypothetical protein
MEKNRVAEAGVEQNSMGEKIKAYPVHSGALDIWWPTVARREATVAKLGHFPAVARSAGVPPDCGPEARAPSRRV